MTASSVAPDALAASVEEWRPVLGYEGSYEVSDLGRVRSITRLSVSKTGVTRPHKGVLLKQHRAPHGYRRLRLSRSGHGRNFFVHVLVADAFCGVRNECVRHLNGKAWDNRAVNLAWGTHAENAQDQFDHGTRARSRESTCGTGHEYQPGTSDRECRVCAREMREEYRARVDGKPATCSICSKDFLRNKTGRTLCPDCNRERHRQQAQWRRINRSVAA